MQCAWWTLTLTLSFILKLTLSPDGNPHHNPSRFTQVEEKTVFDDEAEVKRERAAKRAAEDAERLKGAALGRKRRFCRARELASPVPGHAAPPRPRAAES